ncbi:MAG: hypothetical protein HN926_10390 [Chloroflexi bacterium]|nr:hypothetical protein [Chloroflexota bacterium]MBT3863784.1 hypothetical protein [Chloroflexota bacterium]MBT4141975.1 hypothetical protein [Chloroflexota bacterium]MBT4340503.1 hypothetical protein [Chloroflexota bacterium]MBT4943555.1 hypothetical protein [Chloroflexota bacterium]
MTEPVRFEAEEITPKESGRGMLVESAPFVASVERLMIRVRSANLKDHGQMLDNLQAWIDRAMSGGIDVLRDGDQILGTLNANVGEMIHSRTMLRRIVAPMVGLTILATALAAVTVTVSGVEALFLSTPLEIVFAAIIFGIAGSAFTVLLRAVTMQLEYTEKVALFMVGLARPLVGGVLALAVFALFGAGIISLPLVSDQESTTRVAFLAGYGGTGIFAGQLALFAFAFGAGIFEGYLTPRFSRGVARVADKISNATS